MVDHTSGVQSSVKVRGKDLNGKVVVLDKTFPNQLTLFQTFLPEEDPEDKYSNTIELYDPRSRGLNVPAVFWG
jgi:type IV secretory pathway ATPase VirB11/archaellum biosynthesis ATPase